MSRSLVLVCALAGLLAVGTSVASAGLVGYWPLDEGQGTVTGDASGNGHNGTVGGTPQWVTGPDGFRGAMQFGDTTTGVDCGMWNPSAATSKVSMVLWVKFIGGPTYSQYQGILANRTSSASQHWALECSQASATATTASVYFGSAYPGAVYGLATLTAGQWAHLAVTFDGATVNCYVNGERTGGGTTAVFGADKNSTVRIGASEAASNSFRGAIDDVRLYDTVLTVDEVKNLMTPPVFDTAGGPTPTDKATDVRTDVVLGWTAAPTAQTQNVYFGTSLADVDAGTALVQNQTASSYDPAGLLALGTTYYWRIDEVNGSTIYKGDVWQFTTEPIAYPMTSKITATASSKKSDAEGPEKTIDSSGMSGDVADVNSKAMWMSLSSKKGGTMPAWIQYDFDKLYKLQEMWVWNYNGSSELDMGAGAKGTKIEYLSADDQWTTLGDFEFAQGTAADGYAHNTTVPFNGVAAKAVRLTINETWGYEFQTGLSEVRFFYIPAWARQPLPGTNSTNIDPTTVALNWRPGRDASSHEVYLSTDANALTKVGTVPTAGYTPAVELGTKYYWRIDEVNPTANPTTWASDVWSFTTLDFLTVDDMEIYNATDKAIFDTWLDGYGTTTNGGQVGYGQPTNNTFCETTTFHGGKQSMPFLYGRDGITTSEATRTYATAQNWTAAGAKTLTLWFSGAPENSAVSLYLKVNDTKIVYSGEAGNLQRRRWNQWNIDLSTLPAATVKAVSKVVIGVTGSGAGTLLVDDIRLYKEAPAIPTPADPGTTGLVAYYAMNNNVQDSSGKGNTGTAVGTPTYAAGLSTSNLALVLNGTTDCVDLGKKDVFNPTGGFSISLWAKIGAWGTAWNHVMIGNRGEDNLGWQVRRGSGTGLCWTTRGTGGTADLTGATPAQNEWVHVTCVYDQAGATKTLYINGLMSITGATTAGNKMAATTHNTYIGARALADNSGPDTATFFTGSLDEIRIFDRALTAGEADFLSKP